ncbi:AAA family ATPase [Caulobacter segnis]|uniref:AAA family ATPase n=1 Tax=Caulobacter segnis TaxID=88688 RepID=UPI0024105A04|nr:AAA family ATPase [Caulobacter segnis]MDG2520230.1 AAA family ATPase [Caulobacter segnis]
MTSRSADSNLFDDEFTPPPAAPWDDAFDHKPSPDPQVQAAEPVEAPQAEEPFADFPAAERDEDLGQWTAEADADWAFDAPPAEAAESAWDDDFDPYDSANPVGDLIADVEQVMAAPVELAPPAKAAIHAFYLLPRTGGLIEAATADRRLNGLAADVRIGGLAAALEHYAVHPPPPLILVESSEAPARLLSMVEELRRLCGSAVKLIVLGEANDIGLFRQLKRAGADDYLPSIAEEAALADAIADLRLDRALAKAGRQIAFIGARGGVGASTLAHNFAYVLAERLQSDALLADFDLAFGTAGLDFDKDPLKSVADALSSPDKLDADTLDQMLVKCSERLSLFGAPARLDQDYEIAADAFSAVLDKVKTAASTIVLDMPTAWSAWKRQALIGADEVVLVATPDLTALRNAKNLLDLLRQSRPRAMQPRLVLNQVGVPGRPEIPVKDFCEALGVKASLVLPFEPRLFGDAANHSRMVSQIAPDSKAARGIEQLAWTLSRREPPPAQKPAFLASLLKRR